MKTCIKCGTQNSDGVIFCGACGVNLTYQQYQAPAASFSQSMAANPAVKLLRQFGSSRLFFCAALLYTAVVLILLISVFIPAQVFDFENTFADIWNEDFYDIYEAYNADPFAGFRSLSIFGNLISAVFPILVCIGMWVQYAAFKNTSGGIVKTTGLSLIRVIR